MRTVVPITCSKSKQSRPAAARHLYTGQLLQKSLRYAEDLSADAIFVLSAKHRLLPIDQVIAPYNETLNRMSRQEARDWARQTLGKLRATTNVTNDRFVILAGESYRRDIIQHLANVEVPMQGLSIGQQLRFLVKSTKAAA